MTEKDYMTSRGNACSTEAEALEEAKRYSSKNSTDVKVYKAYKIVSPLTPNVQVSDYTLPVS